MKASNYYGPTPLKVESFENIQTIVGTISKVYDKTFDTGTKLVIDLGDAWSLVLNASNYRVLSKLYGDETDDWLEQPIEAFKGKTVYRGQEQDSVCLRFPEPAEKPVATITPLPKRDDGDFDDDIPF